MDPEDAADPGLVHGFFDEARLVAQLEHPGVLPVHEIGLLPGGVPFRTVPDFEGKTLEEAAPEIGLAKVLRAIRRVAEVLDYAHDRGIVHAGVRPDRVLVDPFGGVYLKGWGNAVRAAGDGRRGSGRQPPDARYDAPETEAGTALDRTADVYSLGATLVRLVAGKPPGRKLSARELDKKAGKRLAAILARATAKRPQGRYATAGELASDLARYEAGDEITARPDSFPARIARRLRRRPRLLAAAGALMATSLLAAAGLGVMAYLRSEETKAKAGAEESARRRDFEENLAAFGDVEPDVRGAEDWDSDVIQVKAALERARTLAGLLTAAAKSPEEEREATRAMVEVELAPAWLAMRASGDNKIHAVPLAQEIARKTRETYGDLFPEETDAVLREASGRVMLRVETDPPGIPFAIHALGIEENKPGALEKEGRGGDEIELEMGGHIVLARRSRDAPEVRLPIYLERGFKENRQVQIPLPEMAPEGFIFVPPGWFKAGEARAWTEVKQGFFMSRTELTWGEYREFLKALGLGARQHEPHSYDLQQNREVPFPRNFSPKPDLPVFGVWHHDLAAYCDWRNRSDISFQYRLPGQVEWEWAARGADGRDYPWGNTWKPNRARWQGSLTLIGNETYETMTLPVESLFDGQSVFGFLQVAGNVSEWCTEPKGERKFAACGGNVATSPAQCRCWFSDSSDRPDRIAGIGGRIVAFPRAR